MNLILDLDTGIDDALAISYAASQDDANLLGITTAFGNVRVETATRNSLAMLELLGLTDVPVAQGSDRPWGAAENTYQAKHCCRFMDAMASEMSSFRSRSACRRPPMRSIS